jgi:hypothetical protein
MSKVMLLIVLYGGLSIAALLLVLIGFAMARSRLEARVMAAIAGALVVMHCAELWFLWDLGRVLSGGDGHDPLAAAGVLLVLLAGGAAFLLARKRFPASFSGDTR